MPDRYASLKQGLVGCWIPSISGSGLLLPDLSGRGNNGALTGMDASDWVSASYGRALDFDGVDDEVTTNAISSLNSANQFTITYWASKNSALSDMLVGSRLSSTNGVWLQWYSDGVVYFSVRNGQQNFIQHSLTYRSDFIHFAATYSNTSSAIYIDGKSVASGTNGTVSSTGFDDFGIGALSGGFFAAGKIDDVRLYSRVLTEPEIRLLASEPGIGFKRISSSAFATRYAYKPAKPRNYSVIRNRDPNYSTLRQGLVAAYCPSISGQGNVLPDLVGGNHGTLTDMTADDWVSSGDGRALDFGDSNDVVSIGKQLPNISGQAELTIAMWAKRNTATGVAAVGQADAIDPGNNGYWHINVWQDGNAYFQVYPNFVGIADNSTTWNFWLLTLKNSQIKGYRNGVEVASTSGPASVPAVNGNFQIGKYWINTATNSQLDDIRIYNRALTEPEIKLLASKRGIGLEPRKPKITFTDLGVQKTYSVVRVKETDYGTLRQGLVGAWCPSLPNGGSGNTLPDVSGYGNHGSLVNMSPDDWVSSQYGRVLDFDGSNDYVSFGGQASLAPSTITFAAWIMRTADWNFSGNIIFWAKPSGAYNGNGFYIEPNTASFSNNTLVVCDGFPNYLQLNQVGNTSFSLNTWTHFAFWIQNGSGQFYLNGLPAPTTVFGSLAITGTNDTKYLLHNSPGYGNFTPAKIDDVRIYNRALSESEIRLLSSEPGIGLRQDRDRNTFYQFPSGARRRRILTGMP